MIPDAHDVLTELNAENERLRTDIDRLVKMVEAAKAALSDLDNHWHEDQIPHRGKLQCTACNALAELDRLAAGGVE